jgi:hypothetical protein
MESGKLHPADVRSRLVDCCTSSYYGEHQLYEQSDDTRKNLLLKEAITTSHTYTVGPLDFCGIAQRMKAQGGGKDMWVSSLLSTKLSLSDFCSIVICEKDPQISPFYAQKHALSLVTKGIHQRGTKRLTIAELPSSKRKDALSFVRFNSKKENQEPPVDEVQGRHKRRRISAEKSVIVSESSELLGQPRKLRARVLLTSITHCNKL